MNDIKSRLIEGATGPWEIVLGLEVHAELLRMNGCQLRVQLLNFELFRFMLVFLPFTIVIG